MRLVEVEDARELGREAMELVVRQITTKPSSLISLPAGNTPLPMFRELVAASRREPQLFGKARFITLDEYADIAHDDRRRLLSWLRREFLDPSGVRPDQIIAFDPVADHRTECERIETAIASLGGLDLAVLGLGPNGHLGFNEPGSSFDSRTRRVPLAAESISSNAVYWGKEADVPRHGLTLGLATLREARSLLLLVSSASKAPILARLMQEPISEALPATMLRLCDHSLLMADRAARSQLGSRGKTHSI